MIHRFCAVLTALLLLALSSCSHKTERADTEQARSVPLPRTFSDPVAPNRCRLICTLVDTDTISFSPAMMCHVRIDSVLGYGSSFGMPLYPGGMITLRILSIASTSPPDTSSGHTLPAPSPDTSFGRTAPKIPGSLRLFTGTVLKGDVERNSVDEDGGGLNFTMYEGVIIEQ